MKNWVKYAVAVLAAMLVLVMPASAAARPVEEVSCAPRAATRKGRWKEGWLEMAI